MVSLKFNAALRMIFSCMVVVPELPGEGFLTNLSGYANRWIIPLNAAEKSRPEKQGLKTQPHLLKAYDDLGETP